MQVNTYGLTNERDLLFPRLERRRLYALVGYNNNSVPARSASAHSKYTKQRKAKQTSAPGLMQLLELRRHRCAPPLERRRLPSCNLGRKRRLDNRPVEVERRDLRTCRRREVDAVQTGAVRAQGCEPAEGACGCRVRVFVLVLGLGEEGVYWVSIQYA